MEDICPMNSGDSASGYANNSQYQKQSSESVKEMIQEAVIEKLDAPTKLVVIADFGCSVGPNTFSAVQNLMEAVQKQSQSTPEFQVYFNDQASNDFNRLFASLPVDRQYYAAGVAGSFYGRLLPSSSITLAYSSHALQCLSRRPQGVPNKGRIHYAGASAQVMRAYQDQFESDMADFLSARAVEMVSGGLMFLVVPGTRDGASYSHQIPGLISEIFQDSLLELADEGEVERGAIDEFNLPIYLAAAGEMRKAIDKNSCFSIERLEVINPKARFNMDNVGVMMRSGTEGIFAAHFGSSVVDKMFAKIPDKAKQIPPDVLEAAIQTTTQLFLVLKRK